MEFDAIVFYGTFWIVIACWIGFASAFILVKRPKSGGEKKRDSKSMLGVAIESVRYFIVWMLRRNHAYLIDGGGPLLAMAFSLLAIAIAIGSGIITVSAVRTLGKQWAVAARVVEGHKLITSGPYARVRNPIYSGMFGMLIATGLAFSQWWALLAGMLVFWIGTEIRIKVEEKLLRETFGQEFDEYAKRVPALVPKVF